MRARIVVATLAVVTITAIIGVMLILTIRVSIQRSAESELLRQATPGAVQIGLAGSQVLGGALIPQTRTHVLVRRPLLQDEVIPPIEKENVHGSA